MFLRRVADVNGGVARDKIYAGRVNKGIDFEATYDSWR